MPASVLARARGRAAGARGRRAAGTRTSTRRTRWTPRRTGGSANASRAADGPHALPPVCPFLLSFLITPAQPHHAVGRSLSPPFDLYILGVLFCHCRSGYTMSCTIPSHPNNHTRSAHEKRARESVNPTMYLHIPLHRSRFGSCEAHLFIITNEIFL